MTYGEEPTGPTGNIPPHLRRPLPGPQDTEGAGPQEPWSQESSPEPWSQEPAPPPTPPYPIPDPYAAPGPASPHGQGPYGPPAAANPYGAPPPGGGAPAGPPPPSHLAYAIVTTLACCMPLGIVSIVFAAQVSSRWAAGDVRGAYEASRRARLFARWSLVLGLVSVGLTVLAVVDDL